MVLHPLTDNVLALQAEATTSPVPDLDYDALAKDLDMKSPLEIMDHVRLPNLFY